MADIKFYFESTSKHGYVGVLDESTVVPGAIVSQNAGSSNLGIYYQVDGGGLNRVFKMALGSQLDHVNNELVKAYDREKVGTGSWAKDHQSPPTPPPLTSLIVPVNVDDKAANKTAAMMYSVGPQLNSDGSGLVGSLVKEYSQIYTDAMNQIASSAVSYQGFRITMLSSGIYRGYAPIAPFSDTAAGAIIDSITAAVKQSPKLAGVAILINTDDYPVSRSTGDPEYSKERMGFTNAAIARHATNVSWSGFTVTV